MIKKDILCSVALSLKGRDKGNIYMILKLN